MTFSAMSAAVEELKKIRDFSLTRQSVVQILGIDPYWILRWARLGIVRTYTPPGTKRTRYHIDDVIAITYALRAGYELPEIEKISALNTKKNAQNAQKPIDTTSKTM